MRVFIPSWIGFAALIAASAFPAHAADTVTAGKIKIVAAENFYGDVARQIGGADVEVTSILSNPDQDPHLFETNASTAKAIAAADIIVYNGADYDPWMVKLLSASPNAGRTAIVAADLVGAKAGDNPHLWYDPKTLPAVAKDLEAALEKRDAKHAAVFRQNLSAFETSFQPVLRTTETIAAEHKGTSVTATEPVFGYMAKALGFKMLNSGFQTAVMNNAEPSATQVAEFEDSLKSGKVKILFYNKQVTDKTTERMLKLAREAKIAVVGVTETEPKGMKVQAWFTGQLNEVKQALSGKTM